MSWTRGLITALAVRVALLAGSAGRGPSDAREQGGKAPSPAGELLDERDEEGRPCREADGKDTPAVGAEVTPGIDDGSVWAVGGEPVEGAAGITVSDREPGPGPSAGPVAAAPAERVRETDGRDRGGGRGSPGGGERA
ncbi:hypothetical protein ACFXAE_21505 [Streptomyces sp. NPDC059454]|uniref:hypothetical protein n=1 Tax=Streptomyces sp. NPDC059454 TaxID=3346836 RepID=UPI003684C38F